jgi:hypothetical protein
VNAKDQAWEQFSARYDAAYQLHLASPADDIDDDEYLAEKHKKLGLAIREKFRIYLDTKFWLHFRDYTLRRRNTPAAIGALYERIKELVDSGKAICPLSAYTVGEVQLQSNFETKLRTANLMDELSSCVLLLPESRRIPVELMLFLNNRILDPPSNLDPLGFMWTRPMWMVDPYDPGGGDGSTRPEQLASKKASIDAAWGITASDIVAQSDGPLPLDAFPKYAAPILNIDKPTPDQLRGKFHDVFLRELFVALDMYDSAIEAAVEEFLDRNSPEPLDWRIKRDARKRQVGMKLVYGAFVQKQINRELPLFRIIPSIMAAYRNDKERRFKPNDLFDFYHAAGALPYCHIYLTEKSMRHLLISKPLELDHHYGCEVINDPAEALNVLNRLAQ